MRYRTACIVVLLLTIASTSSAQFPWQKPPSRSKKAVADILGPTTEKEPSRDLTIVWVWGIDRIHAEGTHEFVKAKDLFVDLLKAVPRVTVDTAKLFPSKSQWEKADLVVFYAQLQPLKRQDFDLMDGYLRRGGGLIVIHAAMISSGDEVAQRVGSHVCSEPYIGNVPITPLQGFCISSRDIFPGRCPGLEHCALSGLKIAFGSPCKGRLNKAQGNALRKGPGSRMMSPAAGGAT